MTTTMNAIAYAISNMSSIGSTGITERGNTIMQILNDTQSMQVLYKFFKETGIFARYEESNERHQEEYYYQIPVDVWTTATGLVPEWFFRVTMDDGTLFYDRFFDADYKDYDSPDRYIYLSIFAKA